MSTSENPYDRITGVILAGGQSTRMEQDKARLTMAGGTLFGNILSLMQALFSQVLIAGDRPDLEQPGVPSYPDLYPGSALGGLYTGLLKAPREMIFVSACDIPFPSADLIRLIVANSAGYDVCVPRTPGGLEPLFAVYHKNCLSLMQRMLEQKQYRISDFYPRVNVHYLEMEKQALDWRRPLLNVNTPAEYERLKER